MPFKRHLAFLIGAILAPWTTAQATSLPFGGTSGTIMIEQVGALITIYDQISTESAGEYDVTLHIEKHGKSGTNVMSQSCHLKSDRDRQYACNKAALTLQAGDKIDAQLTIKQNTNTIWQTTKHLYMNEDEKISTKE